MSALASAQSDLAATHPHQSRGGRRANTMLPSTTTTTTTASDLHAGGGVGAALASSNLELAASFSITNTHRFQPYDAMGILGASGQGGRDATRSPKMESAAVARPGSLRVAPPTFPASLPLPPSGAPTAPTRTFSARKTTSSPSSLLAGTAAAPMTLPVTAALVAGVPPLDPTLASFDYEDYRDGDATLQSPGASSYAAAVLRAVTEGTETTPTSTPTSTPTATGARVPSSNGNSRGRRRSFTGPSGIFAHKDLSDGEGGRVSDASSATHTGGKPMSLTMGAPALLEEQLLYQWDGMAASATETGTSNSPSPAGAIGSRAVSPLAGPSHNKGHHNILNGMPQSMSVTQDLTGPTNVTAMSVSNMWLTTDASASAYWGTTQMHDPLTLPQQTTAAAATTPATSPVNLTAVADATSPNPSTQTAPSASMKSPADLSSRSTARTLPGTTTLPLAMAHDDGGDEAQTVWGAYPDLLLNLSWDAAAAGTNDEVLRRGREAAGGLDPLLYGQPTSEDAERLYRFMTYDDDSY